MLKPTLLANAASCAIFGLVFVFLGPQAAEFLGNPPVILLTVLGAGLLSYSVLLVVAAAHPATPRKAIVMFILGDAAWVLATLLLIIFGLWVTTISGILAAAAVALFVGLCGWFQWRYMPSNNTQIG